MDIIIALLNHTGLADNLDVEDVKALASLSKELTYSAGTTILQEDGKSRDLYLIQIGRVSIGLNIPMEDGTKKEIIFTLRDGQVFGEMSLVDGSPRSATVKAEDDSIIYRIGYSDLISYLEEHPKVGYAFMRNIAAIIATRTRSTNMLWRNLMIW